MENKSIKCRYITPLEWEQTNKKGNYFDNSVKIITDGYETYCCSETIIDSLVEHVNDGTLTSSQKQTTNNGNDQNFSLSLAYVTLDLYVSGLCVRWNFYA